MTSNENLRNYILQKIIKGLHLNKKTFSFLEDKIELSDTLLSALIKECAKYGFNDSNARVFITQTANNITYNPSIELINNNLNANSIEVGQYFRMNFSNEKYGLLFLELVCLELNCFLVIKSTVPGVIPLDVLHSEQQVWNIGYDTRFAVERKGKRYPYSDSYLIIGKFNNINLYQPSFMYKIFDSEEDYSYNGYILKCHTTGNKYVNIPKTKDGKIIFLANEDDEIPKDSLFVIRPNEDKDTATLELNTDYINAIIDSGKKDLLENIRCCCESKNDIPKSNNFKIIMEEPGGLQCNNVSSTEAFWFVTSKPIISFTNNVK